MLKSKDHDFNIYYSHWLMGLSPKVAWDVLCAPFSWAVTDADVLGAAKAVIVKNLESLCSFKN